MPSLVLRLGFAICVLFSCLAGSSATAQEFGPDGKLILPATPSIIDIEPYVYLFNNGSPQGVNTYVLVGQNGLTILGTQEDDASNRALVNTLKREFPQQPLERVVLTSTRLSCALGIPLLKAVYGKFEVWAGPRSIKQWPDVVRREFGAYQANGGTAQQKDFLGIITKDIRGKTSLKAGPTEVVLYPFGQTEARAAIAVHLPYGKTLLANRLFDGDLLVDSLYGGHIAGWAAAVTELRKLEILRIFGATGGKTYSLYDFDRFALALTAMAVEWQSKVKLRLTLQEFETHFKAPRGIVLDRESITLPSIYAQLKKPLK